MTELVNKIWFYGVDNVDSYPIVLVVFVSNVHDVVLARYDAREEVFIEPTPIILSEYQDASLAAEISHALTIRQCRND